jgi:hypothetical protein
LGKIYRAPADEFLRMSFRLRQLGIGVLALFLCGFSSARPATEVICGQVLGGLDEQIQVAQAELAPSRVPASAPSEDARERWLNWSERELKETQDALDALEDYPHYAPARKELSRIGTEWVTFHGYAEEGRVAGMLKVLDSIRARSETVRGMACLSKK